MNDVSGMWSSSALAGLDAWHLPWKGATVPHAVVDINRGCNISCDACYNTRPPHIRTLSEIHQDIDVLIKHRRLDSILLVGGEPLLHPGLPDIVRTTKARGLKVELITNGVLLDDQILARLYGSGLDLLFLHIDRGQRRPDLPPDASPGALVDLWEAKTAITARHGVDVGLAMTAYSDRLADIREMFDFTMRSRNVNFMLVTLFRDSARLKACRGDLASGLKGELIEPGQPRRDTLTNMQIYQYLKDSLGLSPFCYLGSNVNRNDPRWLSYLVAAGYGRTGKLTRHSLKASALEKAYLALALRFSGRYPMYRKQNPGQLRVQMAVNSLIGGDLSGNLRFLLRCLFSGAKVSAKRLLFQCPADIEGDGTVVHCDHCPDAVVRNGVLVPVCISDRMEQ